MTREEHIDNLKSFVECFKDEIEHSGFGDARFDVEQAKKDIETFEVAIQALSQEPCDDAISREDATAEFIKWQTEVAYAFGRDFLGVRIIQSAIDTIRELPSVTQKSGKWIDYSDEGFVECPFCGHATNCEDDIDELHYCFYCGAKMESEDKE